MSGRVLVTGGDGFLGANLVRELHRCGYEIRIFSEPNRETKTIDGFPFEVARGDIRNRCDLERAVDGCDYLIHAAASTSIWPSRSKHLEQINIDGTRNVIDAALTSGVSRLIHVGTANSFGHGTKDDPGTEDRPFRGDRYGLGYIETKREAQRMVSEAITERGLPAVVVAPTFMIGPYDTKPGSGQLVIAIVEGSVPGYARGGRNYVYVKDVACGAVAAIERGRIGEAYILGNENLTYCEFFHRVAAVAGVSPPRFGFPAPIVKATGFFGSLIGKVSGRTPRVTFPMAKISVDTHFYSAEKAVRELGMPQTPIEVAIREALAWFGANGYLRCATV